MVRSSCSHAFVTFSAAGTHWYDFDRVIEEHKAQGGTGTVVDLSKLPGREALV